MMQWESDEPNSSGRMTQPSHVLGRWQKLVKLMLGFALTSYILAACLSVSPACASEQQMVRNNLRRGVNLAHWFAQSFTGYHNEALKAFMTDDEMTRLLAAGFTHVRVPIHYGLAMGDDVAGDDFRTSLGEQVGRLIEAGLFVVLSLHPSMAEKEALASAAQQEALVQGWVRLSRALEGFGRHQVAFELMNEPFPLQGPSWHALQSRIVSAIRTVAPERVIIANPGGWTGVDDYARFQPLRDRHIIYTVHIYDPILFTHQGATWSWDLAAEISGLAWPVEVPAARERAASAAPGGGQASSILEDQIARGVFTRQSIIRLLDKLTAWQRTHRVATIWVGEFGVYRKFAPREARLAWHRTMRTEFETRGWGWTLWDYAGDYGMVRPNSSPPEYDTELLQSLGLGF
jgi:endoglucanase